MVFLCLHPLALEGSPISQDAAHCRLGVSGPSSCVKHNCNAYKRASRRMRHWCAATGSTASPVPAATTPWSVTEDLVLALLVRDAVAAATGIADLRAQGLVIYPAALTATLNQGTWLGVSDVLAAGATAASVSLAAAALTQVG